MGVPKFFRWLTERYPLTQQKLDEQSKAPEIDNLYLDMNGIIHNCTHANAARVATPEPEMIRKCFCYIDRLVALAKPQKVLFMAIDGVAPRAKINHQRARRYKSAQEQQEEKAKAIRLGEDLPPELFDSNCITPGTPFMDRLDSHLKYFIRRKLADDPLWQRLRVVYSGFDVPGEGEHKIMEFVRLERLQHGDKRPNVRHCLYGLDADLIFLGLTSHEPHFCLLREQVQYGRGGRGQPSREVLEMKTSEFQLLHIGILREYLARELHVEGVTVDNERAIDDFVLICVLVGNDFMPPSPTLDIAEGALETMLEVYRRMMPTLGGYLTDAGQLHRDRLQLFIKELAKDELKSLIERAENQASFEQKQNRRNGGMRPAPIEIDSDTDAAEQSDWQDEEAFDDLFSAQATMMTEAARDAILKGGAEGFDHYKRRVYRKMEVEGPTEVKSVVEHYIKGLQWVMEYYYRGVVSWSWYFPFHYAPFLSDCLDIGDMEAKWPPSKPILPYQQLLLALPPASAKHLPAAYQELMLNPASSVKHLFPDTFAVDLEGKRNDWEAVILLPFVDQAALFAAYDAVPESALSPDEVQRNRVGKIWIFEHHEGSGESRFCKSTLPAYGGDVVTCNSTARPREPLQALPAGVSGFVPEVHKGCLYGAKAPQVGWPSLALIDFETYVRNIGANVLGVNSKRDSRVLKPAHSALGGAAIAEKAQALLGRSCFVRYPHSLEAKAIALTDGTTEWYLAAGVLVTDRNIKSKTLSDEDRIACQQGCSQVASELMTGRGIDVCAEGVYLKVNLLQGLLRALDGSLEKRFSKAVEHVPMSLVLEEHPAGTSAVSVDKAAGAYAVAAGDAVVFLGSSHYGARARVLSVQRAPDGKADDQADDPAAESLSVSVQPWHFNPRLVAMRLKAIIVDDDRAQAQGWMPGYLVAKKLGMDSAVLGNLASTCKVALGKHFFDLGLNIRATSNGASLHVAEYAKPDENGKGWVYSVAAMELMRSYFKAFPWIAQLVSTSSDRKYDVHAMFPDESEEALESRLKAVARWRDASPIGRRKLTPVTSRTVTTSLASALQLAFDAAGVAGRTRAAVTLEAVATSLVLPPVTDPAMDVAVAAGPDVDLGDVVVSITGESGVGLPPCGACGVVVGVHTTFLEVLLAKQIPGGLDLDGRVPAGRGAHLPRRRAVVVSPTSAPVAAPKQPQPRAAATSTAHATPRLPDGTKGFAGMGRGQPMVDRARTAAAISVPDPAQALAQAQAALMGQKSAKLAAAPVASPAAAIGLSALFGGSPGFQSAGSSGPGQAATIKVSAAPPLLQNNAAATGGALSKLFGSKELLAGAAASVAAAATKRQATQPLQATSLDRIDSPPGPAPPKAPPPRPPPRSPSLETQAALDDLRHVVDRLRQNADVRQRLDWDGQAALSELSVNGSALSPMELTKLEHHALEPLISSIPNRSIQLELAAACSACLMRCRRVSMDASRASTQEDPHDALARIVGGALAAAPSMTAPHVQPLCRLLGACGSGAQSSLAAAFPGPAGEQLRRDVGHALQSSPDLSVRIQAQEAERLFEKLGLGSRRSASGAAAPRVPQAAQLAQLLQGRGSPPAGASPVQALLMQQSPPRAVPPPLQQWPAYAQQAHAPQARPMATPAPPSAAPRTSAAASPAIAQPGAEPASSIASDQPPDAVERLAQYVRVVQSRREKSGNDVQLAEVLTSHNIDAMTERVRQCVEGRASVPGDLVASFDSLATKLATSKYSDLKLHSKRLQFHLAKMSSSTAVPAAPPGMTSPAPPSQAPSSDVQKPPASRTSDDAAQQFWTSLTGAPR